MKYFYILFILAFLIGCDDDGGSKSKIVKFTNIEEIGMVPEHIMDMEIWDGKLLMGGYYWSNSDKKAKIYAHDIGGQGIYNWHVFNTGYESIYRIWKINDQILNISTEQPPEHWIRGKETGWGKLTHYGDFGWALLGDTLSNGDSVRGYSTEYRSTPGYVQKYNMATNKYENLGNPVRGIDGSNRIVWCMEYYNGKYYAGSAKAENGAYHSFDCGNIYVLEGQEWNPIFGFEVGKPTGSIVSCLAADNRIFFGTFYPQKILIYDGTNWSDHPIDAKGEVSKIWKDNNDHIFAGTYTSDKMSIHQWDIKDKVFREIYSTPIVNPHFQWGVVGVCNNDSEMYIKYRDSVLTRIKKITYREI